MYAHGYAAELLAGLVTEQSLYYKGIILFFLAAARRIFRRILIRLVVCRLICRAVIIPYGLLGDVCGSGLCSLRLSGGDIPCNIGLYLGFIRKQASRAQIYCFALSGGSVIGDIIAFERFGRNGELDVIGTSLGRLYGDEYLRIHFYKILE